MRHLALTAIAAIAFIGGAYAEDAKPTNKNCCCGKPIDATVEPVVVKVGDKSVALACCSAGCHTKVAAMKPEDAIKGVEAHNKADKTVK